MLFGDTISAATAINYTPNQETSVTGNIGDGSDPRDVDLFSVVVQSGDVLSFDIDAREGNLSQLDSILRLFDSNGTQLAVNDDGTDPDSQTSSLDSFIQFTATANATLYIGVSGFSNFNYNPNQVGSGTNGSQGDYRLEVNVSRVVATDAGDRLGTAQSVSLTSGTTQTVSDAIGNNSFGGADVDLFAVQLQAGDSVIADIDAREIGLSNLDSILRVFNSSGTQLAVNDDANDPDSGARTLDSALEWAVTTTGTYYIGVSGFSNFNYNPATVNSGSTGSTGAYRMLVTLDRPVVQEAGDTLATARAASLTAGQTTDFDDEIGNNGFAGADIDLYSVTLQAGDTLVADIDAREPGLSTLDSILRIFNSSGTELAVNDDAVDPDSGASSLDAALEFAAATAGTYYVGVSGYSNFSYNPTTSNSGRAGSTGRYSLLLTLDRPVVREAGDTLASAQSVLLTAGQTSDQADAIGNNGFAGADVDMFAVTLQAGDMLWVDVDANETGLSSLDSVLRIFDSSGTQVAVNDDASDPNSGAFNLDSAIEYAATLGGTYYVGVSGFSNFNYNPNSSNSGSAGSTGAYRLLMTLDRPVVREAGDTIAAAHSLLLSPGQTTSVRDEIGNNSFAGADVDIYAVMLQAGDSLTVDIDARELGLSNVDSIVRVFDSAGTQLAVNDDGTDPDTGASSLDSALEFIASSAGTFYVGVSGYSNFNYNPATANSGRAGTTGAYNILMTLDRPVVREAGDTTATAHSLLLTEGQTSEVRDEVGNNSFAGADVDMFAVTLQAGDRLTADIDANEIGLSSLDSIVRIFNSAGTQLAVNDDGTDPDTGASTLDSALDFSATAAGTYYVGVSGYSNFNYNPATANSGRAGSTGAYNLRLTLDRTVVREAGDTIATAQSVLLTAGQTSDLADEVGNNGFAGADVDLFEVELAAGDMLVADIDARETGLSSLDSILRIFDASGNEVAVNDDAADPDTGASTLDAALEFAATSGGTYYVGVSGYSNFRYNPATANSGSAGSTGAYRLLLTLDHPVVSEAGDTIATAEQVLLTIGQTSQQADAVGNNSFSGADVDMFAVTLQAGDMLVADIDANEIGLSSIDSIVRIFNSSGTQLAVNDDGTDPDTGASGLDSALEFAATAAGTYYVGVSGYSNFNYNPSTANSGRAGSTGAYRLLLTLDRAMVREAGDTLATAQQVLLTSGQTSDQADQIGNNSFAGADVDLFAVTLEAGDSLVADIDARETGLSSLDSILRIFNSAGTQLAVNDDGTDPETGTAGLDSALEFSATAAGTYYVGVSGYSNFNYNPATANSGRSGTTGAYRLLLTLDRPVVREAGDTIATAQQVLLTNGQTSQQADLIGNNSFAGADVDMFAVTLDAGDMLVADIDANEIGLSSLDSILRIFDSSGTQLAVNDDATDPDTGSSNLDSALEFAVTTAGTYYVGVSGYSNFNYNPATANSGRAGSTGAYRLLLTLDHPVVNEAGDTIATAQPVLLTAGQTAEESDQIGNNGFAGADVDLFAVTLGAGETLIADIDARETGLSSLDSILRIFNSSGTQLAVNDDGTDPDTGASGLDSALEFSATTAGTYYVGVSGYSNFQYNPATANSGRTGTTGAYQLLLTLQRDQSVSDAGDTIATAQTVLLSSGQTAEAQDQIGNNSFAGADVDLFAVTLRAGERLVADIDANETGLSSLDSILRIFNAAGTQMAVNDDGTDPDSGAFGLDSALDFTAPSFATYFVGVSGYSNFQYNPATANSGRAGTTGAYRLLLTLDRPVVREAGDTIATAQSVLLTSGQTSDLDDQIGNNSFAGADVDMFAVTLQAGDTLVADVDARETGLSSLDSILRIFNSSGTELAVNDDGTDPNTGAQGLDSALEFAATTAGTYYVGVSGYSNFRYNPATANSGSAGTTGAYRLLLTLDRNVVREAGDTLATAQSVILTAGQTSDQSDQIGNNSFAATDVDLFSVTLQAGDTLVADIDARETGLSSLDSILRIFNSSGTELAVNDDGTDPDTGASGLDSALEFSATTAGTYFVGVSGYSNFRYNPVTANSGSSGTTGAYRLLLSLERNIVREAGDTLATAQNVLLTAGMPTATSDSIGNNSFAGRDVDLFAVQLQAGDTLQADIDARETGLSQIDSFLRVFNSAGTQLAANDDAVDPDTGVRSLDSALELAVTTAGTYYVGVSGFNNSNYNPATANSGAAASTGAYQLLLTRTVRTTGGAAQEPGNTIATSRQLVLNVGSEIEQRDSIGNNAAANSDVDLYAVDLLAGDVLVADIDAREIGTTSTLDSVLRVFNASGVQQAINDDANDPDTGVGGLDSALEFAAPADGRYYVGVSSFSNLTYNVTTGTSGSGNSAGDYVLALARRRSTNPTPTGPRNEQVVWLNFEGGSATNGFANAQNVPRFESTDGGIANTQRQAFIDRIVQFVRDDYETSGSFEAPNTPLNMPITITTTRPTSGPFMTVFIGGTASGLLGIAERVDTGNHVLDDNARVYSTLILQEYGVGQSFDAAAFAVADTISHEMGHNLGLSHVREDGRLMQTGALDQVRTDNERFGQTESLFHTSGSQSSVNLLRTNLRTVAGDATTSSAGDAFDLITPVGQTITRRGVLEFDRDTDNYEVQLAAGDLLRVDVDARQLFPVDAVFTATVRNSAGTIVAQNSLGLDPDSGFAMDPYLVYTTTTAGVFTVSVTADFSSFTTAPTAQYVLNMERLTSQIADGVSNTTPDAVISDAKDFVLNAERPSRNFVEADGDRVTVQLRAGTATIRVQLAATNSNISSVVISNASADAWVNIFVTPRTGGDGFGSIGDVIVEGTAPLSQLSVRGVDIDRLTLQSRLNRVNLRDVVIRQSMSATQQISQFIMFGSRAQLSGTGDFVQQVNRLELNRMPATATLNLHANAPFLRVERLRGGTIRADRNVVDLQLFQDAFGTIDVGWSLTNLTVGAGHVPASLGLANVELAEANPTTVRAGFNIGRNGAVTIFGQLYGSISAGVGFTLQNVRIGGVVANDIQNGRTITRSGDGAAGDVLHGEDHAHDVLAALLAARDNAAPESESTELQVPALQVAIDPDSAAADALRINALRILIENSFDAAALAGLLDQADSSDVGSSADVSWNDLLNALLMPGSPLSA